MAMMTRFDPFRDLQRVQDEMSKLFDDRLLARGGESVGWTPKVDIFEDEEGVALRFELAGVEPKDVDIRFEVHPLLLAPRHHRRGKDPRRVEERRADGDPAQEGRGEAEVHPGEGELRRAPHPPRHLIPLPCQGRGSG